MTDERSSTLERKDEAGAERADADTQGFRYENIGGNLTGPIILNRVTPAATIPVSNDLAVPVINEGR